MELKIECLAAYTDGKETITRELIGELSCVSFFSGVESVSKSSPFRQRIRIHPPRIQKWQQQGRDDQRCRLPRIVERLHNPPPHLREEHPSFEMLLTFPVLSKSIKKSCALFDGGKRRQNKCSALAAVFLPWLCNQAQAHTRMSGELYVNPTRVGQNIVSRSDTPSSTPFPKRDASRMARRLRFRILPPMGQMRGLGNGGMEELKAEVLVVKAG